MIKTIGAEFWRFYNDKIFWPDGAWHDDELITVNGEEVNDLMPETVPDDAEIKIEGGIVFMSEQADEGPSFEAHFRKWRKQQNMQTFVVECSKDKLDAVKAAIKTAGGKIV